MLRSPSQHAGPDQPGLLHRFLLVLLVLTTTAVGMTAHAGSAAPQQASNDSDIGISVFNPRSSKWTPSVLSQVKPGGEFTYRGHLYRMTGTGQVEAAQDIDICRLTDADRPYDNANHRVPQTDDIVQVLSREMRVVGHAVLSAVAPGTRVCFQGKAYDLAADRSLRDTGIVAGRVVQTFKRTTDTLVDLRIRSADGTESVVAGTPEHPFYVPTSNDYVAMGKLVPGTVLKTADGRVVTVVGSTSRHGSFDVHNFEVAGQHNYYVSGNGVLVHNQCARISPPHDMPEAFSDFTRAKRKTPVQGGGKLRTRWKSPDGDILEWDYQHGTFERYNRRGRHIGEFDVNGVRTKPADPTRRIEP